MDRRYGTLKYVSTRIQDNDSGFIGLELHGSERDATSVKARVVYWDAIGQFEVETFGEVPLVILEDLIREARQLLGISN